MSGADRRVIPALSTDVFKSIALLTGMRLDLFTPLAEGPATAIELATKLDADPTRLERLLHALVWAGVLSETDGRFANTAESAELLVRGRPSAMVDVHATWSVLWQAALDADRSIREGRATSPLDFDLDDPERAGSVLRGLVPSAKAAGLELARRFDLGEARHVIDLAGGAGALAGALCESFPGLTATVVDLPAVIPLAREILADHPARGRVAFLAADVFTDTLPVADVVVARNLFQLFGPDACAKLAGRIAAMLPEGGVLHILGQITNDDRVGPPNPVGINLAFMAMYDAGAAYSEAEYRAWLSAAGFTAIERWPLPGGASGITARRA